MPSSIAAKSGSLYKKAIRAVIKYPVAKNRIKPDNKNLLVAVGLTHSTVS